LIRRESGTLSQQPPGRGGVTLIMGQIIIEIPQNTSRRYRIISQNSAKEILLKLENAIYESNFLEDQEILNLLADRKESAIEIAEDMRRSWKRKL